MDIKVNPKKLSFFLFFVIFMAGFPLCVRGLPGQIPEATAQAGGELVAVAYDPTITQYPAPSHSPFDPDENPPYALVHEALAYLNPAMPENPLANLIHAGDTVVIKPNLVGKSEFDDREGVTRTPILRPLVDFAVQAGAARVIIAEGSATPYPDSAVFGPAYANITGLIVALQHRHPSTEITYQDLNLDAFTWIDLTADSSLAGVYSAMDLYTIYKMRMDEDSYYYASDSTGYNPHGYRPGVYAIANTVLEADVFINVPKMKIHYITGVTLSLKNLIGITVSSTGNTTHEEGIKDTPHWNNSVPRPSGEFASRVDSFDNDVLWRVMADLNKIVLYTDEHGVLQPTKTRRYLSVVDGIVGMEGPTMYNPPGTPKSTGVIVAGHDPVAVDMVCTRIMGFNYSILNTLIKISQEVDHPIGHADPTSICVVGASLNADTFPNSYIPHQGYEDAYIAPYQIRLQHTHAPSLDQVTTNPLNPQSDQLTQIMASPAILDDVAAMWLRYSTSDMVPTTLKMEFDNGVFRGDIEPFGFGTQVTYAICINDNFLNTEWSPTHTYTVGSPEGILGHWAFDEGSGGTAYDSSLFSHDAVIYGATWVVGKEDTALRFDGDDYVEVHSSDFNVQSAVTITAWINPIVISGVARIAGKTTATHASPWVLYGVSLDQAGSPVLELASDSARGWAKADFAVPLNTWTHLAGTYDGSAVRLYVNGELQATSSFSGSLRTNTEPFSIGRSSFNRDYFHGIIDEVYLYSRALSAVEIRELFERVPASMDFAVSVSPLARTIEAGATGYYDVAVSLLKGPSESVTLALHGLPENAGTWAMSAVSGLPSFTTTLAVSANPGKEGTYNLRVVGTDGSLVRYSAWFTLSISQPYLSATFDSPATVESGDSVSLSAMVAVSDEGHPSLTYVWNASAGSFSSITSNPTTWIAPNVSAVETYQIQVAVSASGYLGNTSLHEIVVTPRPLLPQLVCTLIEPAHEIELMTGMLAFKAHVTAEGAGVEGVQVTFYFGGEPITGISDSQGYVTCTHETTEGDHHWYAVAQKTNYLSGSSSTRTVHVSSPAFPWSWFLLGVGSAFCAAGYLYVRASQRRQNARTQR